MEGPGQTACLSRHRPDCPAVGPRALLGGTLSERLGGGSRAPSLPLLFLPSCSFTSRGVVGPYAQLKEGKGGEEEGLGKSSQERGVVKRWMPVGTSQNHGLEVGGATGWASLTICFVRIWRRAQRGKELAQSHTALTASQAFVHMSYNPPSSPLRQGNYCNLYNVEGDVVARDLKEVAGGHIGC